MCDRLEVGDVVMIRGDLRINMDGRCAYTPEQLVDGKYLKHTGTGDAWTGKVKNIDYEHSGMANIAGIGWMGIERLEKVKP